MKTKTPASEPISPTPIAISPAPAAAPDQAAIGAEIGRTLLSNALYSAVYDQKDLVKSRTSELSLRTVDQLQIEKRAWTSGKIDSILPVAATQLEHVLSRAKAVKRLNQQKGFEHVSASQVKRWCRNSKKRAATETAE